MVGESAFVGLVGVELVGSELAFDILAFVGLVGSEVVVVDSVSIVSAGSL